MHTAVAEYLDDIRSLCRKHGVKRLEVFGSAARGDDFNPETSDADFVVDFIDWLKKPWLGVLFDFENELENLLGRNVDLIDFKALNNRYVIESINQDRELIYEA
jgi:predicted nucleotidyltransferase